MLQISISNCHCALSKYSYTVYVLCDNEHTPHRVGIRATRRMTTLSSGSGVVCLEHVISIALLDLLSIRVFLLCYANARLKLLQSNMLAVDMDSFDNDRTSYVRHTVRSINMV